MKSEIDENVGGLYVRWSYQ